MNFKLAFSLSLWLAFAAVAQEPLASRAELKLLEKAAAELAKAGFEEEWRDLISIATSLGLPPKEAGSLRAAGEKDLARVKTPKREATRAAKLLSEAAAAMSGHLSELSDASLVTLLAQQLVAIDVQCAPAQAALSRERVGERWRPAGESARAERRAAIHKALQEAHRLPIPIEVRESDDALLAAALGRKGVLIQSGNVSLHTSRTAEQGERILRQVLRACAFVEFTTRGTVAVPNYPPRTFRALRGKEEYQRAIVEARQRGMIDDGAATTARQLAGFYAKDLSYSDYAPLESEAQASLLISLDSHRLPTAVLEAGQYNWICKLMYGTSIPIYVSEETNASSGVNARTSSSDARARAERETMLRLAQAGLLGSRAWLAYLAARREDPPWTAGMVASLGLVQGEDLLKATFVYEFLLEEARLVPLMTAWRDPATVAEQPAAFAAALDESLDRFETRWREWIGGAAPGLVQRLEARAKQAPVQPEEVRSTLRALDDVRARALRTVSIEGVALAAVEFDEELSAGCRAHAQYLKQHPEMRSSWPEAHEQRSDHSDWSAAGAWAGAHSVIASGVKNGAAAIDQWMGTFYHRVPLLDPGLVRVGMAQVEDIAVLDVGSMVRPFRSEWIVTWPADGAKNVPLRFVPELPNPVPGEDQSTFGYPVTLQFGLSDEVGVIELGMQLLEGGEKGSQVPCFYSSPQHPTNPDLAPPNSFCLIPKATLKSGVTYTAVATFADGRRHVWSFRT